MMRRTVLMALATACLAVSVTSVSAQAARRVDVVKVMSLGCGKCLAAENIDSTIQTAARATGGKFIWAPVPSDDSPSGAKERVYYAARDVVPGQDHLVKRSLYKGAQEMGVPLNDWLQVYNWLQQDVPALEPKLQAIFQRAQSSEADAALKRAVRLAMNSGVQQLPTYIFLVDGRVHSAIDIVTTRVPDSMSSLRDDVLARIAKLAESSQ